MGLFLASTTGAPLDAQQSRGAELATEPAEPPVVAYRERHALVIGVNDYGPSGYPSLEYAVADATAFARLLEERFGFREENLKLLLDGDADRAAILRALEDWACDRRRVDPEDLLVIFFAGHGDTRDLGDRGERGYLVPTDGERDARGRPTWGSLLGMNVLEDVSEAIPAKHVLCILDCCFGGLAIHRAAPPIAAGLSVRARQVMTAGSAQQTVLDSGGGQHSVFTGTLLEGLQGEADLDGDQVITFGELFGHVGRLVEQKTERRQSPLQATFPDHEGGSVAFVPPGVVPRGASRPLRERLAALEQSNEELVAEMKGYSDALLATRLREEARGLWPAEPARTPDYRSWLERARPLHARLPGHREARTRLRQEVYYRQVLDGTVAESRDLEPRWDLAAPTEAWRFEVLSEMVANLEALAADIRDVENRLERASTLEQRSIGNFEEEWDQAITDIALGEHYGGLELEPQLGLVPLGPDPESGLWEFWHVESGARPERDPESGRLRIEDETGIVLVLIPGGRCWLGAQSEDPGGPNYDPDLLRRGTWNLTPHQVDLEPFFLSKYEMTQGQWRRATGNNPSRYGPSHYLGGEHAGTQPCERVSWEDATHVMFRLGLVLPTEAQWELAARGGTSSPWWVGADPFALRGRENLADETYLQQFEVSVVVQRWKDGFAATAPVGSFSPNPYGLYDVLGNVYEWCRGPSREGRPEDPDPGRDEVPRRGEPPVERAARGGSFSEIAEKATASFRWSFPGDYIDDVLGVRPAREIRGHE
jgi:formylglycine-generating enzyme required for sulfatase activity